MTLIWIPGLRLSIAVLAGVVSLMLAACGSDSTPAQAPETGPTPASTSSQAATSTPAPPATPTLVPTPTPDPAEQLALLLSRVEEKLAATSTVTFTLVDETESGEPFFGAAFQSLTGKVKSPDRFWMAVKAVAPGFGFVEIEMTAVGEDSYIKFSEDAPWTPLPLEQVPFNFGEIGLQLSLLVPALSNPSIVGTESVGDGQTIRFEGTIPSEGFANLITGVDPGHSIILTFWADEADYSLRQLRISGKLFDGDAPETTRLLEATGIDVDVDIQLPDSAAGQ